MTAPAGARFCIERAVKCGMCASDVPVKTVDRSALAFCPRCGVVLDLSPMIAGREPDSSSAPAPTDVGPEPLDAIEDSTILLRADARFPMPEGAAENEEPGQLNLRVARTLLTRRSSVLTVCAVLLGFLFSAAADPRNHRSAPVWFALVIGTIAALAGVVGWYLARWSFRVDARGLHRARGRFPAWWRTIPKEDIAALGVRRRYIRDGNHAYRFVWDLVARDRAGARSSILEKESDPIVVFWLAQRLRSRLGVPIEAPGLGKAVVRE